MGKKSPFIGALWAWARKLTSDGTPVATAGAAPLDRRTKPDRDEPHSPNSASAAPTSYLNARPPHRTTAPRSGQSPPGRKRRHRLAVLLLALLVATGLTLTGVIVRLVGVGITWSSGEAAAASPLMVPAPALAGGLLRRYLPVRETITQELIAEFIRRFTAATGPYTGHPAALYREPGTVDVATNEPGWVMYLGHNSTASLGAPDVTIGRVTDALTGTSAPNSFWRVAPGPRGGSARCAITYFRGTQVALCAWATEYTVGALMSPIADTLGNELATLMPMMRLDLQPGWASRHIRPGLP
jgi:hypothetical protein